MTEIVLYMAPGTCARVTAIALEELGLGFESRVIRFMKAEHKSQDFKQLNPKGKVPCLIYDNDTLTENVAILHFLNAVHGGLLPTAKDELSKARQIADLNFCASTLHPLVTRIRMPHLFAGKDCAPQVKHLGGESMDEYFEMINEHLQEKNWWYGDAWSVMDAYLYWCFWRVEGAGYDVSRFKYFSDHAKKMEARPSVQRALAREKIAEDILKDEGLLFTPPTVQMSK